MALPGSEPKTDAAPSRRPFWLRCALFLPVVVPLLLALVPAWRGLDFGSHWDEPLHRRAVANAVRFETLLPRWYNYPSMCFWVGVAATAPETVRELDLENEVLAAGADRLEDGQAFRDKILSFVQSAEFVLRTRALFVLLSVLVVPWTYLAARAMGRRWQEGLLAALLVGLSWEVGYHMRWIAPDVLMVQFATLTLWLSAEASQRARRGLDGRRWLLAAAVAAGLTAGTKYTGGLMLLLVWIAGWQVSAGGSLGVRALLGLRTALAFLTAYLVTTPGTLLDPITFLQDLNYELHHYQSGHYGYTVESGLPHVGGMLRYLGGSLFSPYAPLAWAVASASVAGAILVVRESRSRAALLLVIPALYLAFMSRQSVMFVRNLLLFAPFLALLAARAVAVLWERASWRPARLGLGLALAALVVANAHWLHWAAGTIEARGSDRFAHELDAYIEDHSSERFLLSPKVAGELDELGIAVRENATRDREAEVDLVAFYPSEYTGPIADWPGNRPGSSVTWFGPWEVNFDYYRTWTEPRILVITREEGRSMGMLP